MTPDNMTIALYDSFLIPKKDLLKTKKSLVNMTLVNMTLLPIPEGVILFGRLCICIFERSWHCIVLFISLKDPGIVLGSLSSLNDAKMN